MSFEKCDHDDYIFTNRSVMILFWVDAYIFHIKDEGSIDATMESLKGECILEREENVAGFMEFLVFLGL